MNKTVGQSIYIKQNAIKELNNANNLNSLKRSNNSINKFPDNIDTKTMYLLFGYIKNINIQAPLDIIFLCITFYYNKFRIFCFQEQNSSFPNVNISIDDFKSISSKNIRGIICGQNVRRKTQKINQTGMCLVKNFKYIPKYIIDSETNLSDKHSYDVIFNIAREAGTRRECSAYIINDQEQNVDPLVDIYHWELPVCPNRCINTFATYSIKYGLISIGNQFDILKFTDYNGKNELKWQSMNAIMEYPRCHLAAIMANDDNLFCCGGASYSNYADIYNFNTQKWNRLSNMNFNRSRPGICTNQCAKPTIYVAGGRSSRRKVECYDMEKNIWMTLCDTNAQHERYAILWMDDINTLNIASTTESVIEKMDIRENKWNVVVGKGTAFNTVFGCTITSPHFSRLII